MKLKHRLEYGLLRSVIAFLNLFPVQFILLFCTTVGYLVWFIHPFRLPVTYRNMSNVFPEMKRGKKMYLLKRAYINLCRTFGIVFILHRPKFHTLIENTVITGREEVEQALKQNKGIVLTTCHACWFEAYFAWFNMSNLPTTLIYQKQGNPLADAFFVKQRQHFGTNLEHVSSWEKLNVYEDALHRGRMLIVSLDQNYTDNGTHIDFFGHDLSCAKGAGLLHLRTGAPVFTSVYYLKDGQLHIDFAEVPLPQYDEVNEENINDICQRAIKPYEKFIRDYPQQWFSLFHKLWSKKKEDYPPVSRSFSDIFNPK